MSPNENVNCLHSLHMDRQDDLFPSCILVMGEQKQLP